MPGTASYFKGGKMQKMIESLQILLADTYALYLKTQNYHWHVVGENFKSLHELFEKQYQELALAIDDIAERIRTLGGKAPATFSELNSKKNLQDGNANNTSRQMVEELYLDNLSLSETLNKSASIAAEQGDEGSNDLLSKRVAIHEKAAWMLKASL